MFKVGLENNFEGRSLAWILGHPGCFANGRDGSQALAAVPQTIQDYRIWISSHLSESWLPSTSEFLLEETWDCYSIDENFEPAQAGYEVNAWFKHDWLPLSEEDIHHGLMLLAWSRGDLKDLVKDLDADTLARTYPNERWSIAGILNHVGGAEWWYLSRLGLAFPAQEVPKQPFERLDRVRTRLLEVLPGFAGSQQVIGISGEFWSSRKLLRRAVWHERDHIAHIRKLL